MSQGDPEPSMRGPTDSLPRPAPDGHATLVMGRLFMPVLEELIGGD